MRKPMSPRARKVMRVVHYLHAALWALAIIVPLCMLAVSERGLRDIKRQIRAEGLPLTPAELNRPLPPADQNAAPLSRQLTELLDRQPLKGDDAVLNDVTKQVPAPPALIARMRQALARRQDVVALAHQAASRPACVFNRNYALGLYVEFPEYAKMRMGMRVLTNESLVLLADGKATEAIHNEALGFQMAQHAAGDPTLISKLMGVALNAITLRFMERVLYTAGDQPGVAQVVDAAIARHWHSIDMADGMRGEFVMGEVTMDMVRTGKYRADSKEGLQANTTAAPPSLLGRAMIDMNELNLLTFQRQCYQLMRLPRRDADTKLQKLEDEAFSYRRLPTHMLAIILMPVFAQAATKQTQGEAQASVVQTAARLFARHAPQQAFPYSWEPNMPTLPADPFNGRPLEYKREAGGFVVYSAGPTGAFDGGSPDRRPNSNEVVFRYPMPAYYTQSAPPMSSSGSR